MYTMKTKYELVLLALVVLESISLESQAKHRRGPKGQFGRYRVGTKRGGGRSRKEFTFGCQCGIADQGADNAKPNFTSPYEMPKLRKAKKTRIVGGYTPKDRPWMALLELENEPTSTKSFFTSKNSQCGGAIINKEWVLTASHCFCMKPLGCKADKEGKTVVDFELERVTVYVGLWDIRTRRINLENMYKVKEIIIYERYVRNKRDQNDIALVHLERPLEFKGSVQPICLPATPRFPDTDLDEAYVSGWGTLADKTCTTIDKGPAKHRRCKFPFVWMNHTHTTCSSANPPSYYDENCKLLATSANINQLTEPTEIVDESGNHLTNCYKQQPGLAGWCATCVDGARPSEAGFCPKKLKAGKWRHQRPPRKVEKHFGRPSTSENWGLCSMQCLPTTMSLRTTTLQEVQLSTLSNRQCFKFGKSMKAVPRIELCAGNKVNLEPSIRYVKYTNGTLAREQKAAQMDDSSKDFYLGGKDSCKGDSGGPLYTWKNGKAYLIGVVSRGRGCATFNEAGIYTRISKKLRWIRKHVTSGFCSTDSSKI